MNISYSTLTEENVLTQSTGCTDKGNYTQVQHNIYLRNLNTEKIYLVKKKSNYVVFYFF